MSYCPKCGEDHPSMTGGCTKWMQPVPAFTLPDTTKMDRILEELVRIRTLLHELVQNRRNT